MAIWRSEFTIESLNQFNANTINERLGIEFTEFGDDFIKGRMPADPRTHQPYGIVHGGASVVLAEGLGSVGASLCIDQTTHFVVGLEVNANHLRPVREGWVTGIASPAHLGRTIHVWETKMYNDDGKITCISRLTVAIREHGPGQKFKTI